MRLLIFLDTDHISGPARLALDFAVEAQRQGHQILMLGLVRGNGLQPTAFGEAMGQVGIETRFLRERFRFDPAVFGQFKRIVSDFKPDIYQSHGYKGSMLGRSAQRLGLAWQAVFHGFTWENWRVRLYHGLDVRWLRRADEVVVVSRAFGRILQGRGVPAERLRWIPNAISEANLLASDSGEDLRSRWLGKDKDKAILAGVVGRFSPEKAPDIFLEAFEEAAAQNPALQAVMVGDGPTLKDCQRRREGLDAKDRLHLAGFRTDLAAIYRALDMLVIPSRSEGMPTVLIEAMLMGVPVISTSVGAVPDVVCDGQTALIVPIGDPQALAAAMVRLARETDLRRAIADRAGRLAREKLMVEHRTQTLLAHAESLLSGTPIPETSWEEQDA